MGDAPAFGATRPSAATVTADRRLGYVIAKRAFDMAFSLMVFALLWWLFAAIALAIRLDSPGPAIFRQVRVGEGGRAFVMYKFRTMCQDAERMQASLASRNEKDGPVFKIHDDPRVTRVGRLLRRTGLDELPQFANVLAGQISVVGPRPALPREVELYDARQRQRLLVPQGITCLWQVSPARDTLGFDEWVDLDLAYIRTRGVAMDLRIMARTVHVMLCGEGC